MNIWTLLNSLIKLIFGKPPVTNTTTTTSTKTEIPAGKTKIALCMGINDYPGTNNDLQGCVNDAKDWAELLTNCYGFKDCKVLLNNAVTKNNVKNAMEKMLTGSKAGDIMVITYSGHGTSVVDSQNDEIDGKDEAICLYDGLLLDDEIRAIFDKLPKDVKLTFISDSCFSGSVTRSFLNAMNDFSFYSKPKYMPPKNDDEALRLMMLPVLKSFAYSEKDMNHLLISGTDDKSYSYDANINGKPAGAFSYYAIKILKETPKITYNDFYKKLRTILPNSSYPQVPQLEGSDTNKGAMMFE